MKMANEVKVFKAEDFHHVLDKAHAETAAEVANRMLSERLVNASLKMDHPLKQVTLTRAQLEDAWVGVGYATKNNARLQAFIERLGL